MTDLTQTCRFDAIANTRGPRRDRNGSDGFSLIEILIVIAILSFLLALGGPTAGKLIRRSQSLAAYSTVRQTLATARLQAIRRAAPVVVEVSLTADKRLTLHTFQDRANDLTSPLPPDETAAAGNYRQDVGTFAGSPGTDEPTLADVTLSTGIRVWKWGGTMDDLSNSVAFDKYGADATLIDRIIFLPTGGIAPPEGTNSGVPTATGGRGIYFADSAGRNLFRVTVECDFLGRLRVDKYTDGYGYQPRNWTWM